MLLTAEIPLFANARTGVQKVTRNPSSVAGGLSQQIVGDIIALSITSMTVVGAWLGSLFVENVSSAPVDQQNVTAILIAFAVVFSLLETINRQGNRSDTGITDPALLTLNVIASLCFALLACNPLTFVSLDGISSVTIWAASAMVCGLAAREVGARVLKSSYMQQRLRRRIAIFGAGFDARRIHDEISRSEGPWAFAGLYEDRTSPRAPAYGLDIAGNFSSLVSQIRAGAIDEVIVSLPISATTRRQEITTQLEQFPVDVSVVTYFADGHCDDDDTWGHTSRIGAAGLMQIHKRPIRDWGIVAKNVSDRIFALLLLIAFAPVFLLIGAAIKLESRGPMFFRQRRHGLVNEEIIVWKFRTMKVMEDGATVSQATRGDSRVTKVGHFLRKTSLDELPQLINVVMGQMSLVGPRPHAIAHNDLYGGMISKYTNRHQVKPGMTGWAQICGYRGETSDPSMMAKRVEHDLWYIKNWSIWLDAKIVLLTPIYGFVNKNAF
ncbi:MAG: undecaprenyl-phosphate glucose phosphotransferase [Hyphomicrobium sp.]